MTDLSSATARVRGRPLPATVFFGATILLLSAVGSSQMFRDPGTFWHLLTGQRILSMGLPHEDWLTFTFGGKPWIAHQWLAECAMWVLYQLGGYDALLIVASGGLALLFTWIFTRLVARSLHVRWAMLLTAIGVMTSAGSLHLRPMLLSMGFFAWLYARLIDVESGRAEIRELAWLLPVLVVWVNCHGAVIGGIAVIALAGTYWLAAWAAGRRGPIRDRRGAVVLALILAGTALTPLANPYGVEMIRTWLAILRSPVIAESIVEHGSVWRTRSWHVLPLAILYIGAFLGAAGVRWRATSLLPLMWLVLMLDRVRHAPLFAIAALLALAEVLPTGHVAAWLARRRIDVCGNAARWVPIPRLLWIPFLVVLGASAVHLRVGGRSLVGPNRGEWPYELKPQLTEIVRAAHGAPVLNDMSLGGFLSHEIPGIRIFGDDRCELYGDDFLRAWVRGERAWYEDWVLRFDVRIAVAVGGTPLYEYLLATPAWHQVSTLRTASLFVRAGAGDRATPRDERHEARLPLRP